MNETVKTLKCYHDGKEIYGQLYLPKDLDKKVPMVIISHGYGGNYQYSAVYARYLVQQQIACYVFDFCGGSPDSKSSGTMTEMSVLSEKADLLSVIDMIKELDFVDQKQIYLLGESQGGFVSMLAVLERIDDIKGMILFYPALVIPDDARKKFPKGSNIPEVINHIGYQIGRNYYLGILDMDCFEAIQGFNKDVLIIHGTKDSLVPIDYSRKAKEIYPHAKLIEIDGADHGFKGQDLQFALLKTAEFITK